MNLHFRKKLNLSMTVFYQMMLQNTSSLFLFLFHIFTPPSLPSEVWRLYSFPLHSGRMRLSPGQISETGSTVLLTSESSLYILAPTHFKAREGVFIRLLWKQEVWWSMAKLLCDARKAGRLNRSGSANKHGGSKTPTSDPHAERRLENRWITITKLTLRPTL